MVAFGASPEGTEMKEGTSLSFFHIFFSNCQEGWSVSLLFVIHSIPSLDGT